MKKGGADGFSMRKSKGRYVKKMEK